MALTVHYSVKVTILDSNGNVLDEWKPTDNTITTSGDNWKKSALNTSVSPKAVPLDDLVLGAGGLWVFRNRSTTAGQSIDIQSSSGDDTIHLAPGQEALAPLDATGMAAFTATAAAGTPILDYMGIDP